MQFINDLLESMEARRRRKERQAAIFFGVGCALFFMLIFSLAVVISILNAVETAQVNAVYGETYANTCQPVPSGSDSVENLPDVEPPRRILLLTSNTQRRDDWHSEMPAQWRAENADEVALIGCVEEQWNLLETCEYQRGSSRNDGTYTVSIQREQHEMTVVLVNPQTARRIDTLTITGSEPDKCPQDDDSLKNDKLRGSAIKWADVANWVETYMFE